jgi:hypothetical protein
MPALPAQDGRCGADWSLALLDALLQVNPEANTVRPHGAGELPHARF